MTASACSGAIGGVEPGLLSLQLQPAAAVQLNLLKYTVSHERGFVRSGPVAIGQQQTFMFDVDDLPPAYGYVVTAYAEGIITKVKASTVCTGQASFEIRTAQSTALSMRLQCDGAARTGTERAGLANNCPSVGVIAASPAQAPVGQDVQLKAEVPADNDGPLPVAYEWSADSGILSNPAAAQTRFLCNRPGVVAVRLALSDGDPACEESPATLNVTCTDADCISASQCAASALQPTTPNNQHAPAKATGAAPAKASPAQTGVAGAAAATAGRPAQAAGTAASVEKDAGTAPALDAGSPWDINWPEPSQPSDPMPDDRMERDRRERTAAGSGGRMRGEAGAGASAPDPSQGEAGDSAPEPQAGTDGSEAGTGGVAGWDDTDAGSAKENDATNAAPVTRAGAYSESMRSR